MNYAPIALAAVIISIFVVMAVRIDSLRKQTKREDEELDRLARELQ